MTDQQRLARQQYNAQPQVKAHKALVRAIKQHQTPPPVQFKAGRALTGKPNGS